MLVLKWLSYWLICFLLVWWLAGSLYAGHHTPLIAAIGASTLIIVAYGKKWDPLDFFT